MKRKFSDLIEEIDEGDLNTRLTDAVAQVVRGVRKTKLMGTVTLKLTVKPDKRTVILTPDVTTKIPTARSNSSAFFDTEDGDLQREDPKQLALKNVTTRPATPLKAVTGKKDEEN